MKKSAALLALALLAGCSDPPPPAPAPKPVEAPKPVAASNPAKPNMAPPISDAQKQAMNASFAAAREKVKEARALKGQAELIEKTQGREAANDTYVKARDLFRGALDSTEDWVEPELGNVSEAQMKDYRDYFNAYLNERDAWTKENASMGKLHKE